MLNIKSINEDEILKEIIKYYFEDEKKYEELFKFGSEEFILNLFNDTFGSSINSYVELPELYKSLVFTYFATSLKDFKKVERYSKYLLTRKTTNVYVFINNLMRDKTTKEYFEKLSTDIEKDFGIENLLNPMDIEEYNSSDAFKSVDKYVIKYIVDKLFNGIGEYEIYKNYINIRENKYWFEKLENEYNLLKVAISFFEKINSIAN